MADRPYTPPQRPRRGDAADEPRFVWFIGACLVGLMGWLLFFLMVGLFWH